MGYELARPPANRVAIALWTSLAVAVLLVPFAFVVTTLGGLATLMLGSATLALAGIAGGVRLHRPRFPRAWWLIFTSVGLALAGNVIWTTVLPSSISGNPAAINIIYGVTYPILCAGVALLPNHGRPGAGRVGLTESAIIASCVAVIWWMTFVDPTLIDTGNIQTHAYLLVEPFMDLVLLGLGVRLLLLGDARSVAYWLVSASCVARLVADTAYLTVGSSMGFPTRVSIVGWVACNGLLAVAALHPSMKRAVPLPAKGRSGTTRFYFGAVVATPVLTGVFLLREGLADTLSSLDVVVPMIATAVTSALVVERMRQLNRVAGQRTAELEKAQQELLFRSSHDVLTGLPGRPVLHERLSACSNGGPGGALLLLDLDDFKEVNDRHGHSVGDDLLCVVSARLRDLADGGLVARLHSDEFAVLLAGATLTDAWAATERMLTAMRRPTTVPGHELFATVSIGLREVEDGVPADDLMRDAYLALHAAKEAGRNQMVLFDQQLREKRREAARTVERLRAAIRLGEFVMHYQPLIRLADERITGVEALIRWQPAGERMVPPDRFISIAEDIWLIVPIVAWVMQESCRVAAGWHRRHGTLVSVNVSPRQLREPDFPLMVLDALRSSALPPEALILEITEGVLVNSGKVAEQAISHLGMLRSRGVRVAIDDFGTGYSSLAYLRDLPIDHVKIDRSFMPAPGEPDPAARTVVKAIIDLAAGLRLGTIAEGVETPEQVELLRELGCVRAQGFYFSRPVPEADAARLITESASLESH
ncbi:MAG: bifunctional diguanylate cyclase/phosphodiesterase [Actinoplanes sp.]